MRLVTENLILRSLEQRDVTDVYSLTSDPQVSRFMRFDTHSSIEEAEQLMQNYIEKGSCGFAVIEKRSQRFCGVIALKQDEEGENGYTLSIFLSPGMWGKGYGTEALQTVRIYAKDILNAKDLTAYVVAENIASCRVLERNGFTIIERKRFADLASELLIYRLAL